MVFRRQNVKDVFETSTKHNSLPLHMYFAKRDKNTWRHMCSLGDVWHFVIGWKNRPFTVMAFVRNYAAYQGNTWQVYNYKWEYERHDVMVQTSWEEQLSWFHSCPSPSSKTSTFPQWHNIWKRQRVIIALHCVWRLNTHAAPGQNCVLTIAPRRLLVPDTCQWKVMYSIIDFIDISFHTKTSRLIKQQILTKCNSRVCLKNANFSMVTQSTYFYKILILLLEL